MGKFKTLNADELAERWGVSRMTIYNMRKRGSLPQPQKVPWRPGKVWSEKVVGVWEKAGFAVTESDLSKMPLLYRTAEILSGIAAHPETGSEVKEFCELGRKLITDLNLPFDWRFLLGDIVVQVLPTERSDINKPEVEAGFAMALDLLRAVGDPHQDKDGMKVLKAFIANASGAPFQKED